MTDPTPDIAAMRTYWAAPTGAADAPAMAEYARQCVEALVAENGRLRAALLKMVTTHSTESDGTTSAWWREGIITTLSPDLEASEWSPTEDELEAYANDALDIYRRENNK